MKQVCLGKLDENNLPAGPNRHFITVVLTCKQSETSQEMNRTLLKIKVSTWGDNRQQTCSFYKVTEIFMGFITVYALVLICTCK